MKKLWRTDEELFELTRNELYTAVVGDIMDTMGLLNQFLPPQIQPLREDMKLAGRAMPVLEADVSVKLPKIEKNDIPAKPFGLMLEALDDLKPNEVYICSGSSTNYALWGELMSTRAMKLGAGGAVLNGYSRDTNGILELGFATFSWGRYAKDQAPRGKVIDFRVVIRIGDVDVFPGDIVVGDIDGVCIVPQKYAPDVFTKALEKARGEKTVKKAFEAGMSAKEAFEKYGIM